MRGSLFSDSKAGGSCRLDQLGVAPAPGQQVFDQGAGGRRAAETQQRQSPGLTDFGRQESSGVRLENRQGFLPVLLGRIRRATGRFHFAQSEGYRGQASLVPEVPRPAFQPPERALAGPPKELERSVAGAAVEGEAGELQASVGQVAVVLAQRFRKDLAGALEECLGLLRRTPRAVSSSSPGQWMS